MALEPLKRCPYPDESLRFATWNLHGGVGPDGRRRLAKALALARGLEADVLALQEVDGRQTASDPFAALSAWPGHTLLAARTLRTPEGDYGHALVVRGQVTEREVHDLTVPGREPRQVISASFSAPSGPLRILAVHLGLGYRERRRQIRAIADMLGGRTGATVLLGDVNEAAPLGPATRTFRGPLPGMVRLRTFPARRPVLSLDRIWCAPPWRVGSAWTVEAGRRFSDHLPLVAQLIRSS